MIDWMEWIITAGLVAVIILGFMENEKMRNMEVRIKRLETLPNKEKEDAGNNQ